MHSIGPFSIVEIIFPISFNKTTEKEMSDERPPVLQRAHLTARILLFFSLQLHKPALSGARLRISKLAQTRGSPHQTLYKSPRAPPPSSNQPEQASLAEL
jgi:hypothetical protein